MTFYLRRWLVVAVTLGALLIAGAAGARSVAPQKTDEQGKVLQLPAPATQPAATGTDVKAAAARELEKHIARIELLSVLKDAAAELGKSELEARIDALRLKEIRRHKLQMAAIEGGGVEPAEGGE